MKESDRRWLRIRTESNLRRKYQLLFLNEFRFIGLDYGVGDYMMNKLLFNGTVAAFILNSAVEEYKELAFGTYSEHRYDWKGDPFEVKILNEWDHKRIPNGFLRNNKDVVLLKLGFTPQSFIDEYVVRLLDIQETIDTNLNLQKIPFVIKSADKKTIKAIEDLMNNAKMVWVDDGLIDSLDLKVEYLIDKLMLYKRDVEAELLSVLGIDGVKFEKKAQMTKDEINSNNDEIDAYRKLIRDRMENFFEQINEVLGVSISIEEDEDEIFEREGETDEI